MIHLRLTPIQIFVDELFKLLLDNKMQPITETDFNLVCVAYPFLSRFRSSESGPGLRNASLTHLSSYMRCYFLVNEKKKGYVLDMCVPFHYDSGPNLNTVCYGIVPVAISFCREENEKGKFTHRTYAYMLKRSGWQFEYTYI